MKILIISQTPTHPTTAGNRRFILDQIEYFKETQYEVYYLYVKKITYHSQSDIQDDIPLMKDYWKDHLFIYKEGYLRKFFLFFIKKYRIISNKGYFKCDDFYPSKLHVFVNKLNRQYKFDVCVIHYYFLSKLFSKISINKKGIVTHDYFAYKNLLIGKKHVEFMLTANEEAKAMQRCPHIFALNSDEAEYFRRLSPKSEIYNIYSIYKYHPQSIVGNHAMVFLSGSNAFNIKGLKWFICEILPKLARKFRDAQLILGGTICEVIDENISPNVKVVGRVNDVESFYGLADIAINPTFQGTGLKIKTFEAISYDKITVVHPHSMTGIFKKESAPLYASSNPEEWVNYISDFWMNPEKIVSAKNNNKCYIEEMNSYINNEYDRFFG